VVRSTTRPHFTPGKDPIPIVQQAGWAPGPVWKGGESRPHRDSIPGRPTRSSVAIPTEPPGLHFSSEVYEFQTRTGQLHHLMQYITSILQSPLVCYSVLSIKILLSLFKITINHSYSSRTQINLPLAYSFLLGLRHGTFSS